MSQSNDFERRCIYLLRPMTSNFVDGEALLGSSCHPRQSRNSSVAKIRPSHRLHCRGIGGSHLPDAIPLLVCAALVVVTPRLSAAFVLGVGDVRFRRHVVPEDDDLLDNHQVHRVHSAHQRLDTCRCCSCWSRRTTPPAQVGPLEAMAPSSASSFLHNAPRGSRRGSRWLGHGSAPHHASTSETTASCSSAGRECLWPTARA
mmetsp:Transcript_19579/g.68071  ORF Transcript_19579/g.68071 Transcript_19579/m.68071 type:complete len:202 (-) Transcript_19579:273-878(-)